jgi:mRNA interferase HigB
MYVIGQDKLIEFSIKHADAKRALDAWLTVIEGANCSSPHQVKARYPGTDFVGSGKAIFNRKGNHYRLVVKIDYAKQRALIEWIGTHAQNDRMEF